MEIKNITFAYHDKVRRLNNIEACIEKGKITTIIGPNGSGKSTLLSVITNLYKPQAGQITLDGRNISTYKPKELAKKLGVVHQQNVSPPDMTVEKLVHYGRLPYKNIFSPEIDTDEEIVHWALKCTGLFDKKDMLLHTLSGGQQQRAWIAMALAQKTPYLFLDEPTANLDIYFQYEILELIRKLRDEQGLTIAVVLHDINQAIQYSDIIIAMKAGKIIKQGKPEEVITEDLMQEIYGINVAIKYDDNIGMYIIPLGI